MHILELIRKNKITTVDLGYAKFKLTITKYMPDPNAWGLTDTNTQTIHILDCMDNQQAREVIIHEITHAMFEVIGYTSAIQVFYLVLSGFIGLFVFLKMIGGGMNL